MFDREESSAPVVVFGFDRPDHLGRTLAALAANRGADRTRLIVYADGPKADADADRLARIEAVRKLAREVTGFASVEVVASNENLGLRRSIIRGVTETVEKFGRVIVVEDDLVTSPGFLEYMNAALGCYADDERVMHVSGYMFPVDGWQKLPETFFYNSTSCWGWATWARAWRHFRDDPVELCRDLLVGGKLDYFNVDGTRDAFGELQRNVSGELNTWAVRWYASMTLAGGYALHPRQSLVQNVGHDGSGSHCDASARFQWDALADSVTVESRLIQESREAREMMAAFYRNEPISMAKRWVCLVMPNGILTRVRKSRSRRRELRAFSCATAGWRVGETASYPICRFSSLDVDTAFVDAAVMRAIGALGDVELNEFVDESFSFRLCSGSLIVGDQPDLLAMGRFDYGMSHTSLDRVALPEHVRAIVVLDDPVKRLYRHFETLTSMLATGYRGRRLRREGRWIRESFLAFAEALPDDFRLRQLRLFSSSLRVSEAIANAERATCIQLGKGGGAALGAFLRDIGVTVASESLIASTDIFDVPESDLQKVRELLAPEYDLLNGIDAIQRKRLF